MTRKSDDDNRFEGTIPRTTQFRPNANIQFTVNIVVKSIVNTLFIDPSGDVTDAVTGEPVVGATATLYHVSGWEAKTSPNDNREKTCQSHLSKDIDDPWDQEAPTDLGEKVLVQSQYFTPTINPMLTNSRGRYAWDVVAGCWYVVIQAEGYETKVSPIVGVPPEVTDLDIALTPKSAKPKIYLPIIVKGFAHGPDLVVDSLVATSSAVTVTIRNAGNAATPDGFWVDVYFNLNPAPPGINQPWNTIAAYGGSWGVTTTLDPGQSLTLVTGGAYYAEGSSFPAGAQVYAYVDSINHATTHGNILESNEDNNVFGPEVSTAGVAGAIAPSGGLTSLEGLPER